MAETIESFVAKLQSQGVDAGRQEAAQIVAAAQAQARQILAKAEADAAAKLAAAAAEAQTILARGQAELSMAARDAVLRLRDALEAAMSAVLTRGVAKTLGDDSFLAGVIRELITQYIQADLGRASLEVQTSPAVAKQLADWAMAQAASAGKAVDLKGTLAQAGFQYTLGGATVEFTAESIVAALRSLVGPQLQAVLDSATSQSGR